MGMYVSFVRLTPAELEKAESDPEWAEQFVDDFYEREPFDPPDGAEFGLEKSWAGIDYLLEEAGVGVDIQMDGSPIIMGDGYYINGWSAELVKRTARDLRAAPFEKLAVGYDPAAMMAESVYPGVWDSDPEGELEELREYYEEMVAFFDKAAADGYAVLMSFG